MIVKHFKLSQPEKERLIRMKSKTGIQNWNVLCRWALCWSLSEPSIPGGVDPLSDSNVEMDWSTFAGEYSEIFEAIIRQRCLNDNLGEDEKTLAIMDIAKDVDGHILVIPKEHYKNILDCDYNILNAVTSTIKKISLHLTQKC